MNFTINNKTKILIIIILVLFTGCLICCLLMVRDNFKLKSTVDDISQENQILNQKLEAAVELDNINFELRKQLVVKEMFFCHVANYRLARDYSKQFAEFAENAREFPKEQAGINIGQFKELLYIHNDYYHSSIGKDDKHFVSVVRVNGINPETPYSDVLYKIYYFYDPSVAEQELSDCDYYKATGNNVYFAIQNIQGWGEDPEKLTKSIDELDLWNSETNFADD